MPDVEGTIIAMGTCRMLRIRHAGLKFFVEQLSIQRHADNTTEERWATVAIGTGRTGRGDACQWLGDANVAILKTWETDNEPRRPKPTIRP